MRRLSIVGLTRVAVALSVSGFFVAIAHGTSDPAAMPTIHDPTGSMSGLNGPGLMVDDNLYVNTGGDSDPNGIHVGFCPDGTVVHAQVSSPSTTATGKQYWLALTDTSPTLQTPVSATPPGQGVTNPAAIVVHATDPAIGSGGGVFLWQTLQTPGIAASDTFQRWDHNVQNNQEDLSNFTDESTSGILNDVGSNAGGSPLNNDDETSSGGQDSSHPDGDGGLQGGLPVSDESRWDDQTTVSGTIDPGTTTPPCSVLPRTSLALSPDATHLSASGWYNSQSGLTNNTVQGTLTTCDYAHQIDPDVDVASIVYSLNLVQQTAAAQGCGASATFSITTQGTTHITYYGVDNETPPKQETQHSGTVSIDTVPPVVNCPNPAPIFTLGQSGAQITASVSDPPPGSGPVQSSVSASVSTSTVGSQSVTMPTASDVAGNTTSGAQCSYSVFYNFSGFFQPVDNPPALNTVKAGSAVPVKFSLHGNQGLSIFQAGYPQIQPIACPSGVPLDAIQQTVTAGTSSLSYDATSDTYTYTWKTNKAWAGQCGRLDLGLIDGSSHTADFQFT